MNIPITKGEGHINYKLVKDHRKSSETKNVARATRSLFFEKNNQKCHFKVSKKSEIKSTCRRCCDLQSCKYSSQNILYLEFCKKRQNLTSIV
jgi:hypothetical protein